jgi:hypothetical protein
LKQHSKAPNLVLIHALVNGQRHYLGVESVVGRRLRGISNMRQFPPRWAED